MHNPGARQLAKLLLACLIAGLLISVLGFETRDLVGVVGGGALAAFDRAVELATWALRYVLLGAIVVVPVWLLAVAWNRVTRR